MKRIFVSALVIVLALALSMTTACGNRDEEPEPMKIMLLPVEVLEEEIANEAEALKMEEDHDYAYWFLSRYWRLEANFEETFDVGKLIDNPGVIATYSFDIYAASAGDFDLDPTTGGDYHLIFDMQMLINTDELFANLFEEETGISIDGTGMGVSFDGSAHWESPSDALSTVQPIKQGWQGIIMDSAGVRVHPPVGTGLLCEAMEVDLEGDAYQFLIGSESGVGHTIIELYVLIDYNPTGISDDYDASQVVDVYINLSNGLGPGKDLWFEGPGMLFVDSTREN